MKKIFAWIKKNILGIETPRNRKKKKAKRHRKAAARPKSFKEAKARRLVRQAVKTKQARRPVKKQIVAAKSPRPVKAAKNRAAKLALKPLKQPVKAQKAPVVKAPPKPEPKGRKPPKEALIGEITHYFGNIEVAVIKISRGSLSVGDPIRVKGHTTDFKMTIGSMQIDRKPVDMAGRGKEIGVKVPGPVRAGDLVFKPEV